VIVEYFFLDSILSGVNSDINEYKARANGLGRTASLEGGKQMEFNAYGIGLIPVIVILVEVIKMSLNVPARIIPLITIALGLVAAFVYVAPGDPKQSVLVGLVLAFSAMGMWSGAKSTIGK
jgi:hypothetical protein